VDAVRAVAHQLLREGHVNFWSEDDLRDFLAPHGLESIARIDEGRTLLAVLAPGS
jgi:hypothetical protein